MVIWHKLGISENIVYYRILMDGYAGVSFGYRIVTILIRDLLCSILNSMIPVVLEAARQYMG
jgi:hypothetical protein